MLRDKFFMAVLAATVAIVSVSGAVKAEEGHAFTDVGPSYDEAVSFLYEVEVINGKSPTQFGTSQQLTRGDAAVILANALGADTKNAPDAGFTDLNNRVRGSVNALAEWEIISGVTKTQFKPNEPLSRGAMAKFLVAGFGLEDFEAETPFTDVGGVFALYIEALYGTGITNGKSPTSYGTHDNIKRGEFANLLYRTILFVFDDEEYEYFPVVEEGEVISPTSIKITYQEPVPQFLTAEEIGLHFLYVVQYEDETLGEFFPTEFELSADRMHMTIKQSKLDLSGKAGTILIPDFEEGVIIPFDFREIRVE